MSGDLPELPIVFAGIRLCAVVPASDDQMGNTELPTNLSRGRAFRLDEIAAEVLTDVGDLELRQPEFKLGYYLMRRGFARFKPLC